MSVAMMADAADDDATRVEPKPCGSTRSWNQEMGTTMRKKMEIPNFRKIVDRIPWQTSNQSVLCMEPWKDVSQLSRLFLLVATKLVTSTNSNEPLQMACKKDTYSTYTPHASKVEGLILDLP